MKPTLIVSTCLALAGMAQAQSSSNFKLEEHTFNAGGHPAAGGVLVSTNFKISLDAIGDSVASGASSGSGFKIDGGFLSAYPPPGEVSGLRLTDVSTLRWDTERSAGVYNLYRDNASNGFGQCEQPDLTETTTTDSSTPLGGNAFFYLVTARNRLYEH